MNVAVMGGTGFVGSYLIEELVLNKFIPYTLVRKGSEKKISSKCKIIIGNINNEDSILNTLKDVEVLIYNIGIIRENLSNENTFENLHFQGVKQCIDLAKSSKVNRFILMSANGVKPDGTKYQQTKWEAEELLKKSGLDWTIFQPSLIFGDPRGNGRPEFCTQLRNDMLSLPIPAPLFYKGLIPRNPGSFLMSPIHVKNVVEFMVKSINRSESIGQIYELGGSRPFTWKEIIHKIALASEKKTWKIPAPVFGIKLVAYFLERFSWFPVTGEQIDMLIEGNTVSKFYYNDFAINEIPFTAKNLTYLKFKK